MIPSHSEASDVHSHPWLRLLLKTLLCVPMLLLDGWLGLVMWFDLPGPGAVRGALLAAWIIACIATLPAGRTAMRRRLAFLVGAVAIAIFWFQLSPSANRDWAPDVARQFHADLHGDMVHLTDVRDFEWRTDSEAVEHWETRDYDLNHLASVDLALSYWMGPAIAHTLVSFGFDDGRHLVFSSEIRRERTESFSALGGFVRKFEAILVAADERDILRVRTNRRGETMYLYRLQIGADARRELFRAYLGQAAELERRPQFYNTLTSNCTTIVFDLMRKLSPSLPLDYRLLLSGYVDRYAFDEHGLAPGFTFEQLKADGAITDKAKAADPSPRFSELIRRGVPGMPPTDVAPP